MGKARGLLIVFGCLFVFGCEFETGGVDMPAEEAVVYYSDYEYVDVPDADSEIVVVDVDPAADQEPCPPIADCMVENLGGYCIYWLCEPPQGEILE